MTLLIPDAVIRRHFTMRDCIAAVEAGYRAAGHGDVAVSERASLGVPGQARLLTLSAASGALGVSMSLAYTGGPIDVDRRTSTVNCREKIYTVFDATTGACVALVGGKTLSWLNTGAMGAVAIGHLSSPDARSLALVGAGRQARAALAGAIQVRPFEEVRVWSRHRETAEALVREHASVPGIRCARISSPFSARACTRVSTMTVASATASESSSRRSGWWAPMLLTWLVSDSHLPSTMGTDDVVVVTTTSTPETASLTSSTT